MAPTIQSAFRLGVNVAANTGAIAEREGARERERERGQERVTARGRETLHKLWPRPRVANCGPHHKGRLPLRHHRGCKHRCGEGESRSEREEREMRFVYSIWANNLLLPASIPFTMIDFCLVSPEQV